MTDLRLRGALTRLYLKNRTIKKNTLKRLGYDLNRWERYTTDPPVDQIDSEMIQEFCRSIEDLRPATIRGNLKTIQYLLEACHKAGLIPEVPEIPPGPAMPPPTPHLIEFGDLEEFLRSAKYARWPLGNGDYWKRFIGFAYLTGLRRGDLFQVRREDCSKSSISVIAQKTGKLHRFPMPPWLWALIESQPSGRLFPVNSKQLYREMKRICEKAGIPYFTPQDLRVLSANEWESAWPQCGAVIQGGAIPGWSKATSFYLDPASLLERGVDRLRVPEPLLSDRQKRKLQNSRQSWESVFDSLSDESRGQLLGLAKSLAHIPK